MAKKPKISPTTEFVRNAAPIIKSLSDSTFTPLARLAGADAFTAAQDRISDLLNIPASKFTRDGSFRKMVVEIGNLFKDSKKTSSYQTKFKKDNSGYQFVFFKKPTQGGEFSVSTAVETFPGSDLPGFENNISNSDKLSIIWAMMSTAGFTFTPSGETFVAEFHPNVVLQSDIKAKQKQADADQIQIAVDDMSGIAGLVQDISNKANNVHMNTMRNAVFNSAIKYDVEITEFGTDVSVSIRPRIEMSFTEALVPFMAETNDKSANDFLVHSWVSDALDRGVAMNGRTKATSSLPAVDLRVTSDKLRKVADKFQVAKPRTNRFGFCINGHGIPMFVPNPDRVNNSAAFMTAHSNFQPGEDGYLNYEDVAHEWKSKIIMVDWFNDVIVFTQASGKLDIFRMLGFIPLDQTSEYVWLNTSIVNRRVTGILKNLGKIVDAVVSPEAAREELPEAMKSPNSYNAGKITQTFSTLITLLFRPMGGNLQPSDPNFRHDYFHAPLIKHLFGLELEELPPLTQGECSHVAAYLRAAFKKRAEITSNIRERLQGIEYFLIMGAKFTPEVFDEVKKGYADEFEKQRPVSRDLPEFDIPNLYVGDGAPFKGFMPHQSRLISNRVKGAAVSQVGVATGGGKTIFQLVDVLLELQANPTWRPLLVTKPRLVKNMISEINAFTKGQVNVVSLRAGQLNYIARTLKIQTAESLMKWVKGFPPNTIFVCGYTDFGSTVEYPDLEIPDRVLLHSVALPQYLHILRIIGFDSIKLDESHAIKNVSSNRARYSFSMLAQAKSKQELSGTILNNTAIDLMGQAYGLNPMIFGSDVEDFKDEYNLPGGLIKNEQSSYALAERQRKFMQTLSATEEDWAFLLPDLFDVQLQAQMTPKQEKFYNLLMQKAYVELEAKLKGNNSPEAGEESDDEDSEEQLLMAIDATLHTVEQFMLAPDENAQYMTSKDAPSGDDIVSPIVRAIDAKLADIYRDMGKDHSNNKSAVFGIHKVFSGHFMRHTRFKSICLHYRSGDEEVIRQFKSNPDKLILVADSTSLREGENLQMLSQIFDSSAPWAPGDFKQLLARMYRPDPKGVYSKDTVTHYWVLPTHKLDQPTFTGVKFARMISKAIANARFQYEGDPRWREVAAIFGDLDLLKMNLELIFNTNRNELTPYYNAWTAFVKWQRELIQKKRTDVAAEVQNENPDVKLIDASGRVLDKSLFTKLCMKEVKSTKQLPGSQRVFTPWEPGAVPADVFDMSLTILGSNPIERGEFVMTEYGPGIAIDPITDTQVTIELYGMKKMKIYRDRLAVPTGEGVKKLTALISNPTAWARESYLQITQTFTSISSDESLAPRTRQPKPATPAATVPSLNPIPDLNKPKQIVPVNPPKTPVAKQVEEDEDNTIAIDEIYTFNINGMPAIAILDAPSGVENLGWKPIAPFMRMSFTSWDSASKFINSMVKKFAITQTKLDQLDEEMDEFRQGKAMKLVRRVTDAQARQFFMTTHRRLTASQDGRERVDPYWLAVDKNVYLAFSTQSHNPKVITWLKAVASKNPTIVKQIKLVPAMHMKVFNSLNEASQDLKELGQNFSISEADIRQELRDMKDDIQEMRSRHAKPITGKPLTIAKR